MFKLTPNLRLLTKHEQTNFAKIEFVRFRKRKPIHLGTAKSKLFRIPQHPPQSQEEKLELMRLHNNYRTTMKSLRYYFIVNHSAEFTEVSEEPEESRKVFEKDFKRCLAINEKWNEKQRQLRETAIAKQEEEEIQYAFKRIEVEKNKIEELKQMAEEIVKKEKEQSKTFITAENLDRAIEHALANPVDYNFALNLSGEKILGRESSPNKEKDQKVSVSR